MPMSRRRDVVQEAIPALAELAGMIGDPAVRHRGTIGGSIANNDPAADYPAACLALGATIVTNKRAIAADEFFTGLFETALEEGEIITKVAFPIPQKAAYMKFRNPGLALRDGRRLRRQDGGRRARRGDRRGLRTASSAPRRRGGARPELSPAALDGIKRVRRAASTATCTPTRTIAPI